MTISGKVWRSLSKADRLRLLEITVQNNHLTILMNGVK